MPEDDEPHLDDCAIEIYEQFQIWGCYARSLLQPGIEAQENELDLLDVMEGLRMRWVAADELVKQKDEEIRRLSRDFKQLKDHCSSVEDSLRKARTEVAYLECEKQTMQVELDSLNRKVDYGRNLLSSLNVDDNTKPSVPSSHRRSRSSPGLNSTQLNDASIDFDVTGDTEEDDFLPELPKTKYTLPKRSRGQAVVQEVEGRESPTKPSGSVKSTLISKESPVQKSGKRLSMNRSLSESNILDAQHEEKCQVMAEINRHSVKTSSTQDVRQKLGFMGLGPSWTNGFPIEKRLHQFVQHSRAIPDHCDVCNRRIYLGGKPAIKCTDCPLRIHRHCRAGAPTPCIPRGSATPKKTPHKSRPKLKDFCPPTRPMIPSVMIRCVGALEGRMNNEGIYRIPGQDSHVVKLLEHLKSNRPFPKMDLHDTETISGCLKKFLNDLSDSLIPMTSWREFSKAVECNSESMLNNAVLELPMTNRDTLAYFCCHLQRVAQNSQVNMMPLENLARCLGPTIVGVSHISRLKSPSQASEEVKMQAAIMKKLLEMPSQYWSGFVNGPGTTVSPPRARRQIIPDDPSSAYMLGPIGTSPAGKGHGLPMPATRRGRQISISWIEQIALEPRETWIVAPPSTSHRCFGIRAFARLPRLIPMKLVFVLCVFVLTLFSVSNLGAAYSRFGAPTKRPGHAQVISLNQQIMAGQPMRFYGRFRNGNDDVLTRYLNRI